MRGLIAVLYFMALGYAFAKLRLDEQLAGKAAEAYRALVRETVTIYREVDEPRRLTEAERARAIEVMEGYRREPEGPAQ